jgi:hypothetical protein
MNSGRAERLLHANVIAAVVDRQLLVDGVTAMVGIA